MAEIILLKAVRKLGGVGDVVKVRNGYARNYLLPQGIALRANDANRRVFENHRATIEAAAETEIERCRATASALAAATIPIVTAATSIGALYGSVTPRMIAREAAALGIKIAAADIRMDEPIRTVGIHQLEVRLHPEVTAELRIAVGSSIDQIQTLEHSGLFVRERHQEALHLLDELAASLAAGNRSDAAEDLVRIVEKTDRDMGEAARRAVARSSGSQFEQTVREALERLNVDCLVGVDAAIDEGDQAIIRFRARVMGSIPARVGHLESVKVAEPQDLNSARFELSLFCPTEVEMDEPVRHPLHGPDHVRGIEVAQVVRRSPAHSRQLEAIEIWALVQLNGDCVHRRVWRFQPGSIEIDRAFSDPDVLESGPGITRIS